jgi:uncharacterized spore protein YtfJ
MEPHETTADRLLSELLGRNNSRAEITVNAGGVGVWVATTACIVMLAIVLVGSIWVSREFTRQDQAMIELREENKTMQSFLSAIYQIAPEIKVKVDKEAAKQEEKTQ